MKNNKKKNILILLVEDEKIMIRTLEERLKSENFNVTKAYNGEEGLQLALMEHPDLILLDLLMPKVDGIEMLKNLRKDRWGANANVIILTNLKGTGNIVDGMAAGLDDMGNTYEYMIKTDWSLSDLVQRIKDRLKMSKK